VLTRVKRLCQKHGINTGVSKQGKLVLKKADRLNAELAKVGVCNKLDQQSVTAWLVLRNDEHRTCNQTHLDSAGYSI
jgi:hypothetical protein